MERKKILTGKMSLDLRKWIIKCLVWSVALYAAETWAISRTDIKKTEAFEMWLWRRMEKISGQQKLVIPKFWVELWRIAVSLTRLNNENVNGLVMFSVMMCYWETYWKAECWENVPEEEREGTSCKSVKKRAEDRCLWRVLEMEVNDLLFIPVHQK